MSNYGYYQDSLLDACVEAYLDGVHFSDDGDIIVVETTIEERQKYKCAQYVSIRLDENGKWEWAKKMTRKGGRRLCA